MALIQKNVLLEILPEELLPIKKIISEQLPNPKDDKFSYDNSQKALGATDPFFSIEKPTEGKYNLDNLYDWYLTKNPEFKPVNTEGLNIQVPEFNFITAVMAKDLLILQHTKRYPQKHKNNTRSSEEYTKESDRKEYACQIHSMDLFKKEEDNNFKSMSVLTLINDFINTGYLYLKFLVILRHYLSLFTTGELYSLEISQICIGFTEIDKLMDTPYIIYPTTLQLSYAKVIYTAQAPVINFRLSNNRKKIHDSFDSPLFELDHDVGFHSKKTHKWKEEADYSPRIYKMLFGTDPIPFIPKEEYPNINNIIKKLKPYISNTDGDDQNIMTINY